MTQIRILWAVNLFLVILGGCGDGTEDLSPTFSKKYTGTLTITADAQKMIESFFESDTLDNTLEILANDGVLEMKLGLISDLITDVSGTTVLKGTTTSLAFTVSTTLQNKEGAQMQVSGDGIYDGDDIEATLTVTITGGDWNGNVIEMQYEGKLI